MTAQEIIDAALKTLRQWGWETGRRNLMAEPAIGSNQTVPPWLRNLLDASADADGAIPEDARLLPGLHALLGWTYAGHALDALHERDYDRAHQLLDRALAMAADDPILRASCFHCRGAVFHHQSRAHLALKQLHDALPIFGTDHFMAGRVLDTLGMVYVGRDNFSTARELYEAAIACKERHQDDAGLALTHGQLGRLHLDWGYLAEAKTHLRADLELCRRLPNGNFGVAQMYGHLGQVALAEGKADEAIELLDQCIRHCQEGRFPRPEGYARKDRALAWLQKGDTGRAEQDIEEAEQLFRRLDFSEGRAHVHRARGRLFHMQKRYDEAKAEFDQALAHFQRSGEQVEVARTQRALGQLLRERGAPTGEVVHALLEALDSAERSRRHALVREIERDLRAVDKSRYLEHIYVRVRGQVREDTVSLLAGERETVTVLFLDLESSTDYMYRTDPKVVMLTLNQMMADLSDVLFRHRVTVTAYLGDGFMALVRGSDHARRGVMAALDASAVVQEFNRPRPLLELPTLKARTGLSTGVVCLGNMGTYRKMDFTALGTPVNLAARLQAEAQEGKPCISESTYLQVNDAFDCHGPRDVDLKGLGVRPAWDVVRRKGSVEEK